MIFSSFIFLFAFLALHLLVYHVVPDKAKNAVLLVSSLLFYAWGGPQFVPLLIGETLLAWLCALWAERTESDGARKASVIIVCVVLLGLLGYYKYAGFLLTNIQLIAGVPEVIPNIALPLGISFYTFQLISYVVDVAKGEVEAQHSFWKLLLYSSLYHKLIAGPIVRYKTIANEIDHREVTPEDRYEGVRRFCVGLAKKTVLATACSTQAEALVPFAADIVALQTTSGLWLGMLFYTLQIYLDFAAYSDMAIGLGRMIGFHYLENFNYPYIATSVRDFWHRWHISLSTFFRDYVYIPLGGSRVAPWKVIRNTAVVWLLTGLWHGASWNYILWGVYYLIFLLIERKLPKEGIPKFLGWLATFLIVVVGWTLFRFEDFNTLWIVLQGMVGLTSGGLIDLATQTTFLENIFLLIVSCIACAPLGKALQEWLTAKAEGDGAGAAACRVIVGVSDMLVPVVCLVLSAIALAGASFTPFIYFKF